MKKLFTLLAAFSLVLTLAACGEKEETKALPTAEELTMATIDDYLGMEGVQYIDLRNHADQMKDGWINGFTILPFFEYLESENILVRDGDWDFEADEIINANALKAFFPEEQEAIFLMCAAGGRAGYVMKALNELGYTNVYNVGGFRDYEGDNMIAGDGTYADINGPQGDLTPGVYFYANESKYSATLVVNELGGISALFFDAVNCSVDTDADGVKDSGCNTKQDLGDAYGMAKVEGQLEWYLQANKLADAIVGAQGWDAGWTLYVDGSKTKIDQDTAPDTVTGVTVGIDGFKEVFEAVVALATPSN